MKKSNKNRFGPWHLFLKCYFLNRSVRIILLLCIIAVVVSIFTSSINGILSSFIEYVENFDDVELNVTIIALLVACVCFIMQMRDFSKSRKDERKESLIDTNALESKNRYDYSSKMLSAYKQLYKKGDLNSGDDMINLEAHLVTFEGWCFPPGYKDLKKITCKFVENTNTDEQIWDFRFVLGRWFLYPDRYDTYTHNISISVGKTIFDGPALNLVSYDTKDNIRMIFSKTSYLHYYNTCGPIIASSIYRIHRKSQRNDAHCQNTEYDREAALMCIELNDRSKRTASIGLCILTVIKNVDGMDFFLVHRRSNKLAEAAGMTSVIPSGTLEPIHGNNLEELKEHYEGSKEPERNILVENANREFREEVFGFPEFGLPEKMTFDPLEGNYWYLGLGYDPLSTKIEMMGMMELECSDLIRDYNKLQEQRNMKASVSSTKEEKTDYELLCQILEGSSEGDIELMRFNRATLRDLERDRKGMPVFREIMRIVGNAMDRTDGNWNEFEKMNKDDPFLRTIPITGSSNDAKHS